MTLLCLHRKRCQAVVQDKEAALNSSQALVCPVPQSCMPAPSCATQQGFAVLCQHCWGPGFPSLRPKYWFCMVRSECPENLILQLYSSSGASVKRCWNKSLFVPQMSCWCRVNKWDEMLKYCIFLQAGSLSSLSLLCTQSQPGGTYIYCCEKPQENVLGLHHLIYFLLTCGIYISQELPCYSDDRKGAYVTLSSSIPSSFLLYLYVVAI